MGGCHPNCEGEDKIGNMVNNEMETNNGVYYPKDKDPTPH